MFPFDKPHSVKWLFDHIRNYIIAGVIAHASRLFWTDGSIEDLYGYILFFIAVFLFIANALSGGIAIYYWMIDRVNYNFVTYLFSIGYTVFAILMCTALFFASLILKT